MRILHIYKSYFPDTVGGCEYTIKTLTKYTTKQGYQNTLLTLGSQKHTTITQLDHLKVVSFPRQINIASCPMNFPLLTKFQYYANQADLLHFHFPWPYADIAYLLSKTNKPAIVTYQSDIVRQRFLKQIYKPFMRKFLSRIDKIIVTSPNYLTTSQDIAPFRHKVAIIPLGICEQDYCLPQQDQLEKWQKKLGSNFILFLGVLRAYKGLPLLLSSIVDTSIPLVIAGTGPEQDKLKIMSQNCANVHFVGQISEQDKAALLSLCKAVVLPSHLRSEAFGFCLLEGMLYSKPLISTELGTGTSYVNIHNETGLVVMPGDSQALKNALIFLYENDEIAKRMGQLSRQRCQNFFTAKEMANNYIACYQSLL
jgi:O-antigen biosynthesis rhamnosyltransferase